MICPRCKRSYEPGQLVCLEDGTDLVAEDDDPRPTVVEGAAKGRRKKRKVELQAGDRLGEYEITGELGKGGMAQVYAGVHPVIGKRVAIKVLHENYARDPEIAARFVQEARAVNRASTDRIVDIFALGEMPDGRLYLVMDLVEGITLHQLIKQRGPLPLQLAIPILLETARAIEVAHEAGIVHRDLKPQNIMLRLRDEDSLNDLKVLDFGVAKLTTASDPEAVETQTGVSIGTPSFMAPEQLQGEHVGPAADIYALGVTAFQMLTRKLPFGGETPAERMCQKLTTPPPSLRQHRADLPEALERLVTRCLATDASGRPASMTEVIQALQSIEGSPPARTTGETRTARTPLYILGAVAALGLAVLGAVLFASGPVSRREADAAAVAGVAGRSDRQGATIAAVSGRSDQKNTSRSASASPAPDAAETRPDSRTDVPRRSAATHVAKRKTPRPPAPRHAPPGIPSCNYGAGGWLWRDGSCSLQVTSSTPHPVRERLTWFTYGGFHLTGGLFPRCQREQLGGAGGIRARFTGPVLAKLARCHARHARCTPRFWTDAWEVQIKPDGSVSGVRHRKAGGPAGLARCVEPVLRAMSWASCGTPTTMQLDFAALRSRSSPACQR